MNSNNKTNRRNNTDNNDNTTTNAETNNFRTTMTINKTSKPFESIDDK